jgi:DNA processing protein
MKPGLSPNARAILLLTAPLIAGRGSSSPDLLSPGEYNRLARHLREMQRQPADLLATDASELLRACQHVIEDKRLQRLLGRGFLLSQVIERWQTRAIWVVSRADADYPRRLKARLREDAPAILYGCGDIGLLETGGLAVVGSRHVEETLIDYARAIGRLAAGAKRTLVSGAARGIDRAAMLGALEGGGKVSGVLAESLEETAMNREHRNLLVDGQLVLISRCDPRAGFNVGNAMQRNKLIYALADAALVVSSDLNKGGTWAGATEQLEKLRLVPVFVRSTGAASSGLDALQKKGALRWPNPQDMSAFEAVFEASRPNAPDDTQPLPLDWSDGAAPVSEPGASQEIAPGTNGLSSVAVAEAPQTFAAAVSDDQPVALPAGASSQGSIQPPAEPAPGNAERQEASSPADALFDAVRDLVQRLLEAPMTEAEVATALDVSAAQTRSWLQRLVKQGVLDTRTKPLRYMLKSQTSLLSNDEDSHRLRRTATRRR